MSQTHSDSEQCREFTVENRENKARGKIDGIHTKKKKKKLAFCVCVRFGGVTHKGNG